MTQEDRVEIQEGSLLSKCDYCLVSSENMKEQNKIYQYLRIFYG
jgi:hypothetical protein